MQQVDGTPVNQQLLIFAGLQLENGRTLNDYNIYDGTIIDLMTILVGGKPVIYLFSPETLEASVELLLVPQWCLSAIYPVIPIKSGPAGMGQSVSWRVRVQPEGYLTELSTGLDIAYLYWEALYVFKILFKKSWFSYNKARTSPPRHMSGPRYLSWVTMSKPSTLPMLASPTKMLSSYPSTISLPISTQP